MLSPKQIAAIIDSEFTSHEGTGPWKETAAQKIHDLCAPDHNIHVAAAALENEVTSTLIDLLAATILATLIDEEGGGRTNISFSPLSMAMVNDNWEILTRQDGLDRYVSIAPKGEGWQTTTESPADAKLATLIRTEQIGFEPGAARPQAEPHEYKRPFWCVLYNQPSEEEDGATERKLMRGHDREDAERMLRSLNPDIVGKVENRWCLHVDCPTTGCLIDTFARDTPEVASDTTEG